MRPIAVFAAGVVAAAGLAACGGGDSGGSGSGPGYNAGVNEVVNKSDKKGGTLKLGDSDDFDSPDPGNTYYAFSQNIARQYGRALTTFKPAAGQESNEVVPDLATDLGQSSDGGKTWTYKLRTGVKYADGTTVTSKDVKYAVERSNYTKELQLGPKYFKQYLVDNKPAYKGPYEDKSDAGLKSIETPDDQTIVFHLNTPFQEFDYLVAMSQTMPVPKAKDTGTKYETSILSSGPYKVDNYTRGKSMSLSRNPHWNQSTDPIRKALPDKIEIQLKQNADDIDQRLLSGALDMDITGVGVQSGTQPKVLTPEQKPYVDNPVQGFLRFMSLNQHVKPLDNIHCRLAVQYATDKVAAQTAYGGPLAGGDVATTVLPPSVEGYTKFDLYPQKQAEGGGLDQATLDKAKQELQACGKPDGFSSKISARSDRPKEVAMAEAIQQSLAKVGIKVSIVQFPAGDYFNKYVGVPKYVHDHGIGMMIMAWAADWPTGYGFLAQIVHGDAIKPSGGNNLAELDDPAINKALDEAIANPDKAARMKAYGEIDKLVMQSGMEVPLIYAKALMYRPKRVTNAGITYAYGGMYDYLNMGVE
ncbi:ABC transporter substrate-binding protein [Actinomadura madurae]|uniref:ABC transporter substrate-binding protein n=1 Tax=Actinomadura madurae TaxID=1993 RepID=UPI00202684EF|nr:ABC transporter substrate-binding protein [Actinomadura madurae]MCP9977080.1 ABC transporter substrate-binding protein [Actinomadura madurae]MCQ0011408.1 ABC transporter substrate-binding protein [Actinomadura madurae]URM93503.1 ABC transporter substrate-binding protein [Actinomadura madurae]URN04223.1 ABC transporter substrate-binding protein [Actinomadura madurae]